MITVTREILYRTLRAVIPFASEDSTRVHLNSVYFDAEEDGLRLVATDGHTMGIGYLLARGKAYSSVVLKIDDAESLLKALKYDKLNAQLELELSLTESLSVKGADIAFERKGLAEKFPPWRAVLPVRGKDGKIKGAPGVFGLNPSYVARAGTAVKYFGWNPRMSKSLEFSGITSELDPVRMDFDEPDTGTLTMIIMPMRI